MTALVDQRLASLRGLDLFFDVIMTSLTEPDADTEEATERWERTCDRCGREFPDDPFYQGTVTRLLDGKQIIMAFGVCAECKDRP